MCDGIPGWPVSASNRGARCSEEEYLLCERCIGGRCYRFRDFPASYERSCSRIRGTIRGATQARLHCLARRSRV